MAAPLAPIPTVAIAAIRLPLRVSYALAPSALPQVPLARPAAKTLRAYGGAAARAQPPSESAASDGLFDGRAHSLARTLIERPSRAEHVAADLDTLQDPRQAAQLVWARLVEDYFKNPSISPHLSRAEPAAQWFSPQEKKRLRTRMPTLWSALQDPPQLAKLLFMLSFLRLAHPFTESATTPLTPFAYAEKNNVSFALNELSIIPTTESFRRFILTTGSCFERMSVEIKMPGQDSDRQGVEYTHFSVAKELWLKHPRDPGVVKPLFFGQFKGSIPLYERIHRFERMPLGIMIFEYQDGKRLENFIDPRYSRGLKSSLADAAVASIRLHELGFSGHKPGWGSDMHSGNVRVLPSEGGILVGDFGAFYKPRNLTWEDRRRQTLHLIGKPPTRVIKEIYPDVLADVTRGASARQRARLTKVVQTELDYRPNGR